MITSALSDLPYQTLPITWQQFTYLNYHILQNMPSHPNLHVFSMLLFSTISSFYTSVYYNLLKKLRNHGDEVYGLPRQNVGREGILHKEDESKQNQERTGSMRPQEKKR
jgi:hypothetical protein